jgi:hypothetical protein
MAFLSDRNRYTSFGELVGAQRTSEFNFKPTWGVSLIRNTITETGTGASVTESNGEFLLATGTTTTNEASIRTKERGQYQAGTEGEVGVGVRVPTAPVSTAYANWGYMDDNNGFYYGVDSTGTYVARLDGGVESKVYQSSWNKDPMDGTGSSGLTLDLSTGNIFQINFVWYGYGSINFYINIKDNTGNVEKRILVHTIQVDDQASVVDPNQPITIEAFNGASSTTNFEVYVGGRQFSVVDGQSLPSIRNTPIEIPQETVTSTSYVAVAAIRKTANLNGRENSVNVYISDIQVITDNAVSIMLDYGGSSTGGTWGAPSNVDSDETAMEVNTTITGATAYTAVDKIIAGGDKNTNISSTRQERIIFGQTDEVVIYMKKLTATDADVNVILDVEEEW